MQEDGEVVKGEGKHFCRKQWCRCYYIYQSYATCQPRAGESSTSMSELMEYERFRVLGLKCTGLGFILVKGFNLSYHNMDL